MKVMHDRVAAIDVHKDMVKVAVRVPGERRGTRKTDVLEFLPAQPASLSAGGVDQAEEAHDTEAQADPASAVQ